MKLYEYADELKKSLRENQNYHTADYIICRIKSARKNGIPLSTEDIQFIKNYFEFSGYNPKTKEFSLHESDNEDFMEYVNYIFAQLGL